LNKAKPARRPARAVDPARIADRVLAWKAASRIELLALAALKETADILALGAAANRVRVKVQGSKPALCSLINIKSGACSEDCAYCAQSGRHKSPAPVYSMMTSEAMAKRAKELEPAGATHVCLVASGRGPKPAELDAVCRAAEMIRKTTGFRVCGCLGEVGRDEARRMKDAGITRYNHNLETSRAHYPSICTTHTWDSRRATALAVQAAGLELCCGGIIGMGEPVNERISFIESLREIAPEVVTLNFLNPRPGTRLEGVAPMTALEALKWVGIFRLALPKSAVKLAGGRESGLRDFQGAALLGGANGLIIGGYLTYSERTPAEDWRMLLDCGFVREGRS
jgi:biotin synthase